MKILEIVIFATNFTKFSKSVVHMKLSEISENWHRESFLWDGENTGKHIELEWGPCQGSHRDWKTWKTKVVMGKSWNIGSS